MTSPVKFFTDEKGNKMVQMSETHYNKISGSKKEVKKSASELYKKMKKSLTDFKTGQVSPAENLLE